MIYGNAELEQTLRDEAEALVFKLLKVIEKRGKYIRNKHKLPQDAFVRTTMSGVKDIESALQVFTLEYMKKEVENHWPTITLEYDSDDETANEYND